MQWLLLDMSKFASDMLIYAGHNWNALYMKILPNCYFNFVYFPSAQFNYNNMSLLFHYEPCPCMVGTHFMSFLKLCLVKYYKLAWITPQMFAINKIIVGINHQLYVLQYFISNSSTLFQGKWVKNGLSMGVFLFVNSETGHSLEFEFKSLHTQIWNWRA